MSKRILRVSQIYGPGNPIPVGATKFYEDFVYHEGGDEYVPGTNVPRLRLMNLGPRAKGGFEDDVDAVVEGLRAVRDAATPSSRIPTARDPASGKFRKSTKEIHP
jgi:hypothetical protein